MNVGQRISSRRKELGLSADEVAAYLKKDRSTIYRYESNDIEKLPTSILEPLSKILQTTPAYLMGWEDKAENNAKLNVTDLKKYGIRPIETRKFPMLGEIACGKPIFCNEEHETFIEASSDIRADFCLIAKGDSMINARIFDGDVVFVREQPMVENGEIAAVIVNDDEVTLKRFYYNKDEEKIVLQPENPTYKSFIYIGEELSHIRVLGKAVAFMSLVR